MGLRKEPVSKESWVSGNFSWFSWVSPKIPPDLRIEPSRVLPFAPLVMVTLRPRFLPALLLWYSIIPQILAADSKDEGYRTFTNLEGKTIRAAIESVGDDTVGIRREDGRSFSIPLESLSQSDREFIQSWVVGERLADENQLRIETRRSSGETVKDDSIEGLLVEKTDGFYTLVLENRSGIDLRDFEIRYAIRIRRTAAGEVGGRFKDWEQGKITSIELPDGETEELETKKVNLVESRVKPGYVWRSGAPPASRDKLGGIYFAIFQDGVFRREFALPPGLLDEGRAELGLDKDSE